MTHNISASIHQRLLNYSRSQGRLFNEVLQHYALNRFLYRLGQSSYRERFVLKGALMLAAWASPITRPTRDIDLLGYIPNLPETVAEAMRSICALEVEEDGLRFDGQSLSAERIIEGASYAGVRVRFTGYLGSARIPMQIDVGFGDVLVPASIEVVLPALLDLPPAIVLGYSRESAIAEKLQIMVALGEINSRLKDFYDIWLLASQETFTGSVLARAVQATFARRDTSLVLPIAALDEAFADDRREVQWRAFLRQSRLQEPTTLREAIRVIASFTSPVLSAIVDERPFEEHWEPGGPWRQPEGGHVNKGARP